MTLQIQKEAGIGVFVRDYGYSWISLTLKGSILPERRWDISLNGEGIIGSAFSDENGKGGTWSGFERRILPGERRKIAKGVFLEGK